MPRITPKSLRAMMNRSYPNHGRPLLRNFRRKKARKKGKWAI